MDEKGECVMKKIQAVIFDMDGLILDTERAYSEGWKKGAKKYRVQLSQNFIINAAGRSVDDNIQALREIGLEDELIFNIRREREKYFYHQLNSSQIKIKPNFLQLIKKLNEKQIKTGVATSSYRDRVEKIFSHYQFAHLFDTIVTGDEVENVKPAPDVYDKVVEKLIVDKKRTIALEDSFTGAQAASNSGIPVIIVPDQSNYSNRIPPIDLPHLIAVKDSLVQVEEWLYLHGML